MSTKKIPPILLLVSIIPLVGLWVTWGIYIKSNRNDKKNNLSSIESTTNSTENFFYHLFLVQLIWFAYGFFSEGILHFSVLIAPYFLEEAINFSITLNKIGLIISYLIIVYLATTQQIHKFHPFNPLQKSLIYSRLANFLK